ncbi:MAG: hypothetical protein ACPGSD_17185 [Flavobacteriales bacterium]
MNLKAELDRFEQDAIEAWHVAMGNRKISFKISITQAGTCAERIIQSIHIRTYESVSEKTFYQLINDLFTDKVLDHRIKRYFNTIRPASNEVKHGTTSIDKAYLDIIRLNLLELMKWYQQFRGKKIANLKTGFYSKSLFKKPVKKIYDLEEKGIISKGKTLESMESKNIQNFEYLDEKIYNPPIFASLLIDSSGSMMPYRDHVIDSQKKALNALRKSAVCMDGSLFLSQHTFSHEHNILNTLSIMDSDSDDSIVELDNVNYFPNYTTALYDTLFEVLMRLHMEAEQLKETKGTKPNISIGILTDGKDNASTKHNSEDVRKLMEHLHVKKLIQGSVVIGWTDDKELNESDLEKLRLNIGFDKYIAINKSNPSAIRDAFDLWSQQVIE